jgi:serine/threonine protein kinase
VPAPRDAPGKILAGKYELLEKAGVGGMAVVWRARTLGAGGFARQVAVKRIIPHLATSPEFVAMFVEEARVVSELQHPGIAQIHDFGVDDVGHHFLVLEWIEGVDLQELVDAFMREQQPAPWAVITKIMLDVVEALAAAHARKDASGRKAPIFHRDVTPHNVRLGALGYTKLTDFGIKGKVSYLAPEQLRGEGASAASDLFAVGIVLWEALCGRRLFEAPTDMEVMLRVHETKVPDLRELRPDVPIALAQLVHRALARDPAQRFGHARLMARAMIDVLRATPEPVEPRRIAELVAWARGGRLSIDVVMRRDLDTELDD